MTPKEIIDAVHSMDTRAIQEALRPAGMENVALDGARGSWLASEGPHKWSYWIKVKQIPEGHNGRVLDGEIQRYLHGVCLDKVLEALQELHGDNLIELTHLEALD